MKIMKKILYLLILFFTINFFSYGQIFKNDWAKFKAKNWTVNYSATTYFFLGKQTHGRLIFKNLNDSNLTLYFDLFYKNDIDSIFNKNEFNWKIYQSCLVFGIYLNSFYFGDYYYLPQECHRCVTEKYKDCDILKKSILKYITEKLP
jgi:hypothetical protein